MTAHLTVSVPEDGSAAVVSGSLRVGTLTFVELGDGETLTASSGGQTATLKRGRFGGSTSYSARLDGVTKPGTEIVFALQRGGEDDSAPRSTVTLPEPVRLTAPAAGTSYSRRSADIGVRFTSGSASTVLTWAGECIEPGSLELEPGRTSATISRGSIKPTGRPSTGTTTSPAASPGTCQIAITVTRRSDGTLDPAFKDGSIRAESQSTRQLTSAP
ncbi:hypothetical protein EV643_12396 [Kribbella sp. VKM Ac-2527]|uniref:Uncharacterized protein n=1 Tax=Kribbella caucasensis TaxID=2512215 RepID=A0A4R6JH28_9ACTN|nr:hypothetical protein [Kribbella sp. VKM Ac-2527]TDO35289.1 hypothetical protein EV643_12396 [Kribbella sp. VKM Ac-2527]